MHWPAQELSALWRLHYTPSANLLTPSLGLKVSQIPLLKTKVKRTRVFLIYSAKISALSTRSSSASHS